MAEVRPIHRQLAAALRTTGWLGKRSLALSWLLMQALVVAGGGVVSLGLLVMWVMGLWWQLNHELLWGDYHFWLVSALIWGLAAGYAVTLRVWWPYARRTLQGQRAFIHHH